MDNWWSGLVQHPENIRLNETWPRRAAAPSAGHFMKRGFPRAVGVALAAMLLASCAQLSKFSESPRDFLNTLFAVSAANKPSAPPPAMARPSRPPSPRVRKVPGVDVVEVQRRLAVLGFPSGPADGVMGPMTAKAIRKYQRAKGLPVDGKITAALLAHLKPGEIRTAARVPPPRRSRRNVSGPLVTRGPPKKKPVVKPQYRVGTTFIYSDGRSARVMDVKGSHVKWRRSDGMLFTADRNFLLPMVYWETAKERGRTVARDGGSPWPARAGQTVTIVAERTIVDRAKSEKITKTQERWVCGNEAQVRLNVLAGSFDTIKFVCRGVGNKNGLEMRVWYYAPKIGHYVRFERLGGRHRKTQMVELVAIAPAATGWPPLARAELEKQVVDALSSVEDGVAQQWTSTGVDTQVTITAISRFAGKGGALCRTYVQSWKKDSKVHHYPGAVCRTEEGEWRLPVGKGGRPAVFAVSPDFS